MSELSKQEKQSETLIQHFDEDKLRAAIVLAIERVGSGDFSIDHLVRDIKSEFIDLDGRDILKGIRAGSLGRFGRTYKLTIQDVCIWIRQYQDSLPEFDGLSKKIMLESPKIKEFHRKENGLEVYQINNLLK